jgi:hypothetical protein
MKLPEMKKANAGVELTWDCGHQDPAAIGSRSMGTREGGPMRVATLARSVVMEFAA